MKVGTKHLYCILYSESLFYNQYTPKLVTDFFWFEPGMGKHDSYVQDPVSRGVYIPFLTNHVGSL